MIQSELEPSESGKEERVEIIDSDVDEAFMQLSLLSATSVAQPCMHGFSNPQNIRPLNTFLDFFCLMTFFHLCYRISDFGITLLLVLFKAMLKLVATIIAAPYNNVLEGMIQQIPQNVYFLNKTKLPIPSRNMIRKFVACPSCSTLLYILRKRWFLMLLKVLLVFLSGLHSLKVKMQCSFYLKKLNMNPSMHSY